MFENVIRFIANVEGKVSHWLVDQGTSIDAAEKMCLQFLQSLGTIKAQNEAVAKAQKAADDAAASEAANKVASLPTEDHAVNAEPKPAE